MNKTPLDILKQYWDYHKFRPLQEEAIINAINKKDGFVLLPTGGGKSICYQIPALLQEGICLVISPLIALMKDQVQSLNSKGIKALMLDSSLHFSDIDRELNNCLYGNYKFLYLSPERLQSDLILERLKLFNINLIAVDEAHCISQWGSDFRPAYSLIQKVRDIQPLTPIIALTGSARPQVVKDIINNLQLKNPNVFSSSFKRENLAYMVFKTSDKYHKLNKILKKNPESSIIYVRNRKKTQELSKYLNQQGFYSSYYHGGLTPQEKEQHFNDWKLNQVQVMVATNAFGMGIDKSNVKTVIHLNLTENLENYYQEAGRAGRNNKKAFAITLYDDSDIHRLENQFLASLPNSSDLKIIYRKLCSYLGVAYQEGEHTTHDFNIYSFCNHYQFSINKTVNALNFLDRQGILRFSKNFKHQTEIQFVIDNYNLTQYISTHKHHNAIINCILRKYGGAFESNIKIDLNFITQQLNIDKEEVKNQLNSLKQNGIIELKLYDSDITLTFLEPREDDNTINRVSKYLKQQNKLKQDQIESVKQYILNTKSCKQNELLKYFGEENLTDCGICSYCLSDKLPKEKISPDFLQNQILTLLQQANYSSKELLDILDCNETDLINNLSALLDVSKIKLTSNAKYSIS
ncbi:RecQ family ATP-dependent DNA helicase [Pseudofulvibacter geojedonensis]|uniref:ATP-dependent DNA helicase RecQ n=1 Tax=Pseudofulvibacter geojedonensis TaxID=1123758 RepID=A0ABW3HZW7_9FLAO